MSRTHRERALMNQLRKARQERDELASALADERILRRAAWATYHEAMQSRMMAVAYMMSQVSRFNFVATDWNLRYKSNVRKIAAQS